MTSERGANATETVTHNKMNLTEWKKLLERHENLLCVKIAHKHTEVSLIQIYSVSIYVAL